MSKHLTAACLAALSLTACTQQPGPTPPPPRLVTSLVPDASPPPARPVPVSVTADAGVPEPLELAHQTPEVDHLARSTQLTLEGELKGALLEARRALFTTPEDAPTLGQVARLARRLGQPRLAARAWSRLAALDPTDATPLIAQGRALLADRDFEGALQASREAITRDEGHPEGYQLAGLAQLARGDLAGAISSFEGAVTRAPQHGWALNNLGLACLRANDDTRAVEVLERAALLLPQVAAVHNNLGVALERVGRAEEARAAYQHAMDLAPRYVKARLNAARVARAPRAEPEVDLELESVSDVPLDAHPLP